MVLEDEPLSPVPDSTPPTTSGTASRILGGMPSLVSSRPPTYHNIDFQTSPSLVEVAISTPPAASPATRRPKPKTSLSLLLSTGSSQDSIEIPPSLSANDDSTVSSFQQQQPASRSLEPVCCWRVTIKQYLATSMLLSFILFVWCSVLGFIFGLLLGLVAFNVDLLYFYLSARGYYTVQLRRRRQLKILHSVSVILTVTVICWLFVRLCCARTYVRDSFPTRCYSNALGTVPPACVRVTGQDGNAPYSHGLTAPRYQTSKRQAVADLVREWAERRTQTRLVRRTGNGSSSLFHIVAISGFWGVASDLIVSVECESGVVVVRVHAEQRLGTLDGDANLKRCQSLLGFISNDAAILPHGVCTS